MTYAYVCSGHGVRMGQTYICSRHCVRIRAVSVECRAVGLHRDTARSGGFARRSELRAPQPECVVSPPDGARSLFWELELYLELKLESRSPIEPDWDTAWGEEMDFGLLPNRMNQCEFPPPSVRPSSKKRMFRTVADSQASSPPS